MINQLTDVTDVMSVMRHSLKTPILAKSRVKNLVVIGSKENLFYILHSGCNKFVYFLPFFQTFHTPSLGDEEFEIPPISLDPDSALTVSDVVSHFDELSDTGPSDSVVVPGNAVVEGNDPSFASTYVNASSQGLEHMSLGVINQSAGSNLLASSLGMVRGPEPFTPSVSSLKTLVFICLFLSSSGSRASN